MRHLRSRLAPTLKRVGMRVGVYDLIRRLKPHAGVAILRYHAICDPATCDYASPAICMAPEDFESQVAYIARRYRVLPLPEVADAFRAKRPLPPNVVVFTFDDGYADNLNAAQILARHRATGTFYLTAGCLGGEAPFWVSEVRMLVKALPGGPVRFGARGTVVDVPMAGTGDREEAIRAITRMMKSNAIPTRERLREELREAAGRPSLPDPMLTWDQVRELQGLGMTVGAHTMTHANLPSAGMSDAVWELRESKARLEAEVRSAVTMLSYPNGGAERYFTLDLMAAAERLGYACATTSQNGLASRGSHLFALERVSVSDRLHELLFRLEAERFVFQPKARREPRP